MPTLGTSTSVGKVDGRCACLRKAGRTSQCLGADDVRSHAGRTAARMRIDLLALANSTDDDINRMDQQALQKSDARRHRVFFLKNSTRKR